MKRSKFNLSRSQLLTTDFGTLTPCFLEEVLPNDTVKISTEVFTRFQALIAPIMQRVDAKVEFFFVPNRILWDGWREFITDTAQNAPPTINLSTQESRGKYSLADYFGLPVRVTDPDDPGNTLDPADYDVHNALPYKAYQRIWFDWYADQNLNATEITALSDQHNNFNAVGGVLPLSPWATVRKRAYPRDYFTSALPWAQAGTAPKVPLTYPGGKTSMNSSKTSGNLEVGSSTVRVDGTVVNLSLNQPQNIVVGPTIEDIRRTNAIQRWMERNARYGRRYIEQIAAHFGVVVPDYRLSRSEFLGSAKLNVVVSEVLQKSETTQTSPLGQQGGHGVMAGLSGFRKYNVPEHGYVMGILSFIPRASYGQGVPRLFSKTSYLDFAFPEFDRLGEQPIYQREVDGYSSNGSDVFGYQPRYEEYKRSFDRFSGDFRDTLAFWHLGRIWDNNHQPALNRDFITIDGAQDSGWTNRIFATQEDNTKHILCQLYHHVLIKRPLSRSIPSL